MTPQQRDVVKSLIEEHLKNLKNPTAEDMILRRALAQMQEIRDRERISGRLVRAHVHGMRLPHDALPVKLTDDEASAILALGLKDRVLARMMAPGPRSPGRR